MKRIRKNYDLIMFVYLSYLSCIDGNENLLDAMICFARSKHTQYVQILFTQANI